MKSDREANCYKCLDTYEVDGYGCKECCEHEFDADEGFMCLYCGEQGEPSDLYNEDYGQER